MITETTHLILRKFLPTDAEEYRPTSVSDAHQHISQIVATYQEWGLGLWAVLLKDTHQIIGQCGLIPRIINEKQELEINYCLETGDKNYTLEAAQAVVKYAINTLDLTRLVMLIARRDKDVIQLAAQLGMDFESTQRVGSKLLSLYVLDIECTGLPEYFSYTL